MVILTSDDNTFSTANYVYFTYVFHHFDNMLINNSSS